MNASKRKMAEFLNTVSEFRWDDFIRAELDPSYTTRESIVFALVRACAMENLSAIKSAINRLDGKVETPIHILMPKVFYLYPNATEQVRETVVEDSTIKEEVLMIETVDDIPTDVPTKGFRETIARMAEFPRDVPNTIIEAEMSCEDHLKRGAPLLFSPPQVKAVVAAHILHMAQERNIDAMEEIFNNLDGKLVETIRVVGEDMYIVQFSSTAPPGSIKNADGIYQLEASKVQNMWRDRLSDTKINIIN